MSVSARNVSVLEDWESHLRGSPTDLADYLSKENCCRIHQLPGDYSENGWKGGCANWRVGTHPSIAVLYNYDCNNTVCHVQEGQRVFDRQVAERALRVMDADRGYLRKARNAWKYKRGGAVRVSVYGAGYCYLLLFVDTARSRVARILGPHPLLADVLKVFLVLGEPGLPDVLLTVVGKDMLHVVVNRASGQYGDTGSARFFFQAIGWVMATGGVVRVGAESDEEGGVMLDGAGLLDGAMTLDEFRIRHASVMEARGCEAGSVYPSDVTDLMADKFRLVEFTSPYRYDGDGDRARRLVEFVDSRVDQVLLVTELLLSELMTVTCSLAVLTGSAPHLKLSVKNYERVGDGVLRTLAAMANYSSYGDGADFSTRLSNTTNVRLSAIFVSTKLGECCDLGSVHEASAGGANILESVVGVLAMWCGMAVAASFSENMGIIGAPYLQEGILARVYGPDYGVSPDVTRYRQMLRNLGVFQ